MTLKFITAFFLRFLALLIIAFILFVWAAV